MYCKITQIFQYRQTFSSSALQNHIPSPKANQRSDIFSSSLIIFDSWVNGCENGLFFVTSHKDKADTMNNTLRRSHYKLITNQISLYVCLKTNPKDSFLLL